MTSQSSLIHRSLSHGVIATIAVYQTYLSPFKGFSCAHRRLHDGPSCSQFVKQAIAAAGCRAGWAALLLRARECRDAAAILRSDEHAVHEENTGNNASSSPNETREDALTVKSCLQAAAADCGIGCCFLPFGS